MPTVIHADIFFVISSIGFSILFAIGIVAALYIVSILKSIRRISQKLESDVQSLSIEAKSFFGDIQESVVYRMIFGKKRKLK